MGTVNLEIFVQDIATVLQSYDSIKIQRSTTGEAGVYEDLTAASAESAELLATIVGPYSVVGMALKLIVDHAVENEVTFTGTNPLSVDQVVDQINVVWPGLAEDDGGYLKLVSGQTGTLSLIEITDGASAAEFGWAIGDRVLGKEEYLYLATGVSNYYFQDKDGDADYYYISAFYNTSNNLQSAWSEPFRGSAGTVITSDNRSLATVDLVDQAGAAISGQRILFYSQHEPIQVEGFQAAMVRSPTIIETDNVGHAEVSLIRGLKLRVVFEGTSYIREITVPDQTSFDILELMASVPDPFNPVDPEVPFAIRRTL